VKNVSSEGIMAERGNRLGMGRREQMEKEESQIKSPDGVKYLQAVEEEM
jgi:hypothetical protein